MTEWHLSEELFQRFLKLELSRDDVRQVVRHLVRGCPRCAEIAHRLTAASGLWSPVEAGEVAYDQVLERALELATEEERRLALERLEGWGLWAQLEPLAPQARFEAVESDAKYHTWGFYDRLLEASRWYVHVEPAEAVDIVRLAVLVAEQLDPRRIGRKRAADLQAAAWAALANAKRIASDFEGARRAFNEAWRIVEEGTGDPLERAHLITLEASYMKDVGEFETAEASLEEALRIYRRVGDTHQQGRTFLKMGDVIGYVDPERGLAHIRKAFALIDTAKDPRLELSARHDYALFLNESGRPEEALAVLDRARPLYEQFEDELTQLRLHWLEGKISHGLGKLAEAESIFVRLWEEFRVRDLKQEIVLVSIDIARVLTAQGEPARAADLVAQCHAIMAGWGLHRDALAAWLVLQEALAHRKSLDGIFQEIERYYRRHWVRPGAFRG